MQSLARRTARAIVHFMEVNTPLYLPVTQHWTYSLFVDKRHLSFLESGRHAPSGGDQPWCLDPSPNNPLIITL